MVVSFRVAAQPVTSVQEKHSLCISEQHTSLKLLLVSVLTSCPGHRSLRSWPASEWLPSQSACRSTWAL